MLFGCWRVSSGLDKILHFHEWRCRELFYTGLFFLLAGWSWMNRFCPRYSRRWKYHRVVLNLAPWSWWILGSCWSLDQVRRPLLLLSSGPFLLTCQMFFLYLFGERTGSWMLLVFSKWYPMSRRLYSLFLYLVVWFCKVLVRLWLTGLQGRFFHVNRVSLVVKGCSILIFECCNFCTVRRVFRCLFWGCSWLPFSLVRVGYFPRCYGRNR